MTQWQIAAAATAALALTACGDDPVGSSVECYDRSYCAVGELCDPATNTCVSDPGTGPEGDNILAGTFTCEVDGPNLGDAEVEGAFGGAALEYDKVRCETSDRGLRDMLRVSFRANVPLDERQDADERLEFELVFNPGTFDDDPTFAPQYPYQHPLPDGRFLGAMHSELVATGTDLSLGPMLPAAYVNIGSATLQGAGWSDSDLSGSFEVRFEAHGQAILGAPCDTVLDCRSPTGLECIRLGGADGPGMCLWGTCVDDPRCQSQFPNAVCVLEEAHGYCVPTCTSDAGCFEGQLCSQDGFCSVQSNEEG